MGQLAGLKRRKLALEMLGAAVQAGLDKRSVVRSKTVDTDIASNKRSRDDQNHLLEVEGQKEDGGPETKKAKVEAS